MSNVIGMDIVDDVVGLGATPGVCLLELVEELLVKDEEEVELVDEGNVPLTVTKTSSSPVLFVPETTGVIRLGRRRWYVVPAMSLPVA